MNISIIFAVCSFFLLFPPPSVGKEKSKQNKRESIPAEYVESEILDDSPFTELSNQSFFSVNKKNYEASLNGFTTYMNDLKKSQPSEYKLIHKDYKNLLEQKQRAKTWSIYMAGAGGASLLAGLTVLQDEETDSNGQVEKKPNIQLVAGGFILGFLGSIVYLWLTPGEPEFLDFIKMHNKKVKNKINWDIGYNAGSKAPSFQVGYRF